MNSKQTECLQREQLLQFIQGMLPEAENEKAKRHLADCNRCAELIRSLGASIESLTTDMSQPPAMDTLPMTLSSGFESSRYSKIMSGWEDWSLEQLAKEARKSMSPTPDDG